MLRVKVEEEKRARESEEATSKARAKSIMTF